MARLEPSSQAPLLGVTIATETLLPPSPAPLTEFRVPNSINATGLIALAVGEPKHKLKGDYGINPELLKLKLLAAAEQRPIDLALVAGYSAQMLVSAKTVDVLHELRAQGAIGEWGIRARTAGQVMRSLSLLGPSHVQVDVDEVGPNAIGGVLAAAKRARAKLILTVPASLPPARAAKLLRQCAALTLKVRTRAELNSALKTITTLTPAHTRAA